MAFKTIFRYEKDKKIAIDKKAEEITDTDFDASFEQFTDEEKQLFKFIYEREVLTTKLISYFVKDRIIDYNFTNNLNRYEKAGILDSYFILSSNNERNTNMYCLSSKAAAKIKNIFSLESDLKTLYDNIEKNDVLYILKRMALNQFYICNKEVDKFEVFSNQPFDAHIMYVNDKSYYPVKVARCHENENDEVINAVNFHNEHSDKSDMLIILGEDTDHIVSIERYLLDSGVDSGRILYQTDIMAMKYPEFFQTVSFNDGYYSVKERRK